MKAFESFRLDTVNHCLWRAEERMPLTPKAFDVLRYLVEHADRLVSQEEILEALWSETYVNPEGIRKYILEIRKVLGDRARPPLFIQTLPKRGYQFIANLTDELQTPSAKEHSGSLPQVPLAQRAANVDAFTSLRRASGFVGRGTEMAKLRDWLGQSVSGKRQTVFITGEPGIGKTSTVEGLLEQAAQVPGVLVAHGQCLEHYGAGEAYLPVLDGLSRLCRSAEGSKVLAVLRQHAPGWLAQMPSLVAPTEGEQLPKAGDTTRERMLREMAEAIDALTLESPLLLILEDLHWSDYSTLDLVSYLARRRDPARLMVIGTYRPVEVILADHPLKSVKRELQAHGLCHDLTLECLSEKSVAEYVAARFPGHEFPAGLRRTIYRRTEGNPLFMVNLMEYLTDRKMIVESNGKWKLHADLSKVEQEVPVNLRQLIEKQIERLSPDERTVLEGASVAGMECSSVAIAAGLDMPVEWVEKHCEELARRHQFLSPGSLVELPDRTITARHRFIHVLNRDVPYKLMAPMRRSQIHHRIGERGVVIYGDRVSEIAAELAMHFEQSHDWPRALEFLLQSAENAAAHSAHHEAIDLAKRGLEALKLLPEAADNAKREMKLRRILSVSLTAIEGFASPEVERINARGHELFWRHGPSPELFYMLWSLNLYRQFSGDMHASFEITLQLMQLAEDLKDSALIAEAHSAIGSLLVLLGRSFEALEHLEKGIALHTTHPNQGNRVFANFNSKVMFQCFSAMALLDLGYPDQSAKKVAAGLALARELGHPETLVVAGHIAAQLHPLRREAAQKRQWTSQTSTAWRFGCYTVSSSSAGPSPSWEIRKMESRRCRGVWRDTKRRGQNSDPRIV
jgi:DNA-binding winged helix-turn-helix (wHTH) protein